MAYDVFISYSTKDKTIADAVCAKLEESKIRVWIAPRDIPSGMNFAKSIIHAINTSKVFVLIWSAHANVSEHILNEINQAFDQGVTIIPFRVQDIQPTDEMRYYFGRTHWLDAIDPPLEKHIATLRDNILVNLGRDPMPTVPEPPLVKKQESPQPPEKPAAGKRGVIPLVAGGLAILTLAILWFSGVFRSAPPAEASEPLPSSTVQVSSTKPSSPTAVPTAIPTPTPLPYRWTRITSAQFLARDEVTAVAVHPTDMDTMYAGTRDSGVYKTSDAGKSWLPVSSGITGANIHQILIDPQHPETVFASGNMGVFRSMDGGASWQWLDNKIPKGGQRYSFLAMNPSDPAQLVYTNRTIVSETRDSGETWTQLPIPFEHPGLVIIEPDSGNLIAVAGEQDSQGPLRIYLSEDDRKDWQLTLEEKPTYRVLYDFNTFQLDQIDQKIIICIWVDRFQSGDGGLTWQRGELDICPGNIAQVSGSTKRKVKFNPSVWVSDDAGDSWNERVNGLGAGKYVFGFDPEKPVLYLGGEEGSENGFFAFSPENNGIREIAKSPCGTYPSQVWEQAACIHFYDDANPETNQIPWELVSTATDKINVGIRDIVRDPRDPDRFFLATDDGVFLSSDGGNHWNTINDGFLNMRIVYDLAFDPRNPDDLYALTPYGVYKLEKL